MADRIARLVGDPELASDLGRAGRELVEREFSLEEMTRATIEVYTRAVEPFDPSVGSASDPDSRRGVRPAQGSTVRFRTHKARRP
jgi:hypothetical protein